MLIEKMLVLSTGNLSESTANYLDGVMEVDEDFPLVIYMKKEYGWFIVVPDEPLEVKGHHQMAEDLYQVLVYARENGCDWVMFDRGADIDSNLPDYDW